MPQRIFAAGNHVTIMRTLDQNGGIGGYSDRKPSKLEQMRADYQKKLLKEKEEKMVHLYEENQRKAMMRLTKNGNAGNGDQYSNGAGSPTGGKSVRDFFNERRRLEAAGAHVPNIDQHYKQAKGYASPGGWSSRTGSGNSITKGSHLMHTNKNSAGRDRAQPLAPIQRRTSLATETTGNNNINNGYNQHNGAAPARSGIPLRHHNPPAPATELDNPFNGRPALIKHQPLPPTTNGHAAPGRTPQQPSSLPRYVHPTKKNSQSDQGSPQHHYHQQQQQHVQRHPQQQAPQQQSRQPHPPPGGRQGNQRVIGKPRGFAPKPTPVSNGSGDRNRSGKLTDFQKWQMEQNQAREERLKKLGNDNAYDGDWDQPEGNHADDDENDKENGPRKPVINYRDRLNRLNGHIDDMKEDDDDKDDENDDEGEDDIPEEDEDEEDQDDVIKEQEMALMEQIAAKQREMEKLRKEREQEEEESKLSVIEEEAVRTSTHPITPVFYSNLYIFLCDIFHNFSYVSI
ncbi:zinc finger C2HC domain-containing protein 1C-like isoform X1 [Elysia marginata]|uniref:Zinc finger C2HC domain-containing protein 1C-like isoform X1 n=1 Tax=Elysia marginata TaxID=1093978 RepID=A0AAV4JU44_9GAST|nr:zinc finger C2HC domain-containing protein 1C-like isoform X1 [Elysia marginata]